MAILIGVMVLGGILALRLLYPGKHRARTLLKHERRTGFGGGNPFHAVTIRPDGTSCQQVQQIAAQRFLSEEAPPLPLPECSNRSCDCRYVHHADRRDGSRDRRNGSPGPTMAAEHWKERNRRTAVGRREHDLQLA